MPGSGGMLLSPYAWAVYPQRPFNIQRARTVPAATLPTGHSRGSMRERRPRPKLRRPTWPCSSATVACRGHSRRRKAAMSFALTPGHLRANVLHITSPSEMGPGAAMELHLTSSASTNGWNRLDGIVCAAACSTPAGSRAARSPAYRCCKSRHLSGRQCQGALGLTQHSTGSLTLLTWREVPHSVTSGPRQLQEPLKACHEGGLGGCGQQRRRRA